MTTYNLTPLEKKFCGALADALKYSDDYDCNWKQGEIAGADNPGYDFYTTGLCGPEDIEWDGSKQQLGGLLRSLDKKGVICMEERVEMNPRERFVDIWGIPEAVRALAD